ncbi:heterokaryon incompatibility protein-domain-containing protein [Fusarium flagelliforme]|uniref:heterokaryon incompatibility protein-domain-containing protein n=1 Tax=Fusarium flagelliforme TaxID=2675880 RepID=UPI001E8CEF91|nr:heterokaryon incompatibility protein-domain-containing protein [Fusarium flagelliforme]KAH7174402.1 heterokaryon incompatibility protein-domain-containing protein [Fusarium flagelliforme]
MDLDQPCQFCKVLDLDDSSYGGKAKIAEDGTQFVDFGKFVESLQDRIVTSGSRQAKLGRALSHAMQNANADALKTVAKTELGLEYSRSDELPELPGIGATASAGCAFCRVLQTDLREAWGWIEDNWDDEDEITADLEDEKEAEAEKDAGEEADIEDSDDEEEEKAEEKEDQEKPPEPAKTTGKQPSKAQLVISEITYKLRDYGRGNDGSPGTWADALRPYTSDPLSPTSLKRMNELIRQAEEKCPLNIVERPFLPTRLLDVQADCPSGLRLVITETDPEICKLEASQRRYAALSYCWGSGDAAAKQLKTVRDTVKEHCTSIAMEKVPQTVAETVQVCRAIGIRFLWVDALCIIQHDEEDWSKESFQMSLVYENSYFTLCAIQGDSCSSGFLHKDYNPPCVRLKFQSRVKPSVSGNIILRMLHHPLATTRRYTRADGKYRRPGDSPGQLDLGSAWGTRAWTFQEDQLAPRKIFFGNLIFHVSHDGHLEAADGTCVGHERFIDSMDSDSLQQGLSTWYRMVSVYSQRNLSFQTDKLPAIAAVARSFSERFPDQKYLAGLWESDIHKGLLWSHPAWKEFDDYQKLLSKDYVAPSWSWARRPLQANWLLHDDKEPKSELIVRGTDIVPEQHNPFGRVSKGRLMLTARMYKPTTRRNGKVRIKRTSKWFKLTGTPYMNYALFSKSNKCIAKMVFEWDNFCALNDKGYPRGPMKDIRLVLTASIFPGGDTILRSHDLPQDQELLLGIVVRPSLEEEGAYEKLGLFYSEQREKGGRKFWENVPMQDIVLV